MLVADVFHMVMFSADFSALHGHRPRRL